MKRRIPDSPEGVALALFEKILKADPTIIADSAVQPKAATMLDLFSEYLSAVHGEREQRQNKLQAPLSGHAGSALQ